MTHIWHQYSVMINGDRDAVAARLKASGVPHNIYYPVPLHLHKPYANGKLGDFPKAEYAAKQILALPMHSELTTEDVEYVAGEVIAATQP